MGHLKDLNDQSLAWHKKHYGTTESRAAKRAELKAQRKLLKETTHPHLGCYSMSDEESDTASEWWDEHECSKRGQYRGATGGGNSVSFSSCSIGTSVTLTCYCGATKDVTDYGSW